MEILTVKDIQRIYGLPRDTVYEILRRPRCPLITGKNGRQYRIEREAFERFLQRGGRA